MNENTTKLIEQLANKLGTTSEYLWSILLKQARVSAIMDIWFIIIVIASGFGIWKLHKFFAKKDKEGYCGYNETDGGVSVVMGCFVFIWIICVLAIIFSNVPNMINGFFNPEYWALNEVLETLGK